MMKFETIAIHGVHGDEHGAVNPPVYLSSTYKQPSFGEFQNYAYARGGNPTRNNVETLVAKLEGANYAYAFATGMAATSTVFHLLSSGDKVLLNNNVYGGTYRYVSNLFEKQGLEYELIDDFRDIDFDKLEDNVKAIFIETPSNPLLRVTDIEAVAKKAKEKGILTIVDNTFLTAYYQKPLSFGADIVVYSATKYYSGHADILAGLVVTNNEQISNEIKFLQNTLGGVLAPSDCFLLLRGIKTLALRMDRHEENTKSVITFLQSREEIKTIYYPTIIPEEYEVQKKQSKGNGAVFSIILADNVDVKVFVDNLLLFDLAVSLGGVESLVCHPASMTHESYPQEIQDKVGIDQKLIRFSVGVEALEDIISDLKQALEKAKIK